MEINDLPNLKRHIGSVVVVLMFKPGLVNSIFQIKHTALGKRGMTVEGDKARNDHIGWQHLCVTVRNKLG